MWWMRPAPATSSPRGFSWPSRAARILTPRCASAASPPPKSSRTTAPARSRTSRRWRGKRGWWARRWRKAQALYFPQLHHLDRVALALAQDEGGAAAGGLDVLEEIGEV